jgi:uncharacterized protein YdeI (YjbR/CyaY-like superfamily)
MLSEKTEHTLEDISNSLKGTDYELKRNEPHSISQGFIARIYATTETNPYLVASIKTRKDGNLMAAKFSDEDPIPEDLREILERTELKEVQK